MLAWRLGAPPLAISREQADNLSSAIVRLQKHYPVQVSEKARDWLYLSYVLGTTYAPIAVEIYRMKKEAKKDTQENGAAIPPT